jgi:hypothetical protein
VGYSGVEVWDRRRVDADADARVEEIGEEGKAAEGEKCFMGGQSQSRPQEIKREMGLGGLIAGAKADSNRPWPGADRPPGAAATGNKKIRKATCNKISSAALLRPLIGRLIRRLGELGLSRARLFRTPMPRRVQILGHCSALESILRTWSLATTVSKDLFRFAYRRKCMCS